MFILPKFKLPVLRLPKISGFTLAMAMTSTALIPAVMPAGMDN